MRYQQRGFTPVWILIGINTFVFIITMIRPDMLNDLALTNPISGFNYWTIGTAMFAHANILHVFTNMLTLYFFGILGIQIIGAKWFLAVYFIGGIIGNLLFLLIGPMYSAVVGASGAIFAIGGALVMMRPKLRVYLYLLIPMPLWAGIIIAFLLTAFGGGVAWQAHLGGLITGLLAGFILRQRERRLLGLTKNRWGMR